MNRSPFQVLALCVAAALLAGCAASSPPTSVESPTPPGWQAPLPHNASLTDLSRWWQQFNDPLLVRLIDASEAQSPTVAQARSRLLQAQAARQSAAAALLPSVDANLSASRGFTEQTFSIATTRQATVQASWEIDLFGAARASRNAADERLLGSRAQWHDARVSVAAETANQYYALRACELQRAVQQSDTQSRSETSRLSELSTRAGFTAPANAALARASAAEGNARLTQQAAQCDVTIKGLVALSGMDEPSLRRELAAGIAQLPQDASVAVSSVPAQVLSQRPDVYSAARDVAAAAFDTGAADARRYPALSLTGSVGALWLRTQGTSTSIDTWSIGPLALSVPLFDGGRRAADLDTARARYDEAAALYRAKVRQAVREVEEALVNLQSAASRSDDARIAAEGYRASFAAVESRYKSGLGSLLELEDARRTQLAAETSLVSLQRERVAAWIALYRAAGGGWTPAVEQTAHQ